jgi:ribonuclease HI
MDAHYTIVSDGGSIHNGADDAAAYGSFNIRTADGKQIVTTIHFDAGTTNNEAEYLALIRALEDLVGRIEDARANPKQFNVHIISDSQVMLYQVNLGDELPQYSCRAPNLISLRDQVRQLLGRFREVKLEWVRREFIVGVLGH